MERSDQKSGKSDIGPFRQYLIQREAKKEDVKVSVEPCRE